MATMRVVSEQEYRVIHPLKDATEQKCSSEGLGPIALSRSVRVSLWTLRAYLILMAGMLGYHVLDVAGVLRHLH